MDWEPPSRAAPRPGADPPRARGLYWRAGIAAAMLVVLGISQRVPNPWRVTVRRDVLRVLTPGTDWTAAAWQRRLSALVHWVEHRSWGTVALLWTEPGGPGGTAPAWAFPVNGARVITPYGWHQTGRQSHWNPGITLEGPQAAPVVAVAGGTVETVGSDTLTLAVTPSVTVRYLGLAGIRVSSGQVVPVGTVLGHLRGTRLVVEVLLQGYPVNPEAPRYLGAAKPS
jgi:murein DD-endopeptidase MepM/ murein hydrolase activator NlpD